MRDQVARLTADWNLADPNPEHYGHVLQHLASAGQAADQEAGTETTRAHRTLMRAEPLRILQMSLECGVFGPLASKALIRVVAAGQLAAVQALIGGQPRGSGTVSESIQAALTEPETLRLIATREPVDFTMLEGLAPRLTLDGYTVLLDALMASETRTTRRRLLDLLTQTDLDLTGPIVERLDETPWYAQRNMLVLLHRRRAVLDGLPLPPWLTHPDGRVRTEAIRVQLQLPGERDPAVLTAIGDDAPVSRRSASERR